MGYKPITVGFIIQYNLGVSATNTEVFCLSANPRIRKDNAVSVCRGELSDSDTVSRADAKQSAVQSVNWALLVLTIPNKRMAEE